MVQTLNQIREVAETHGWSVNVWSTPELEDKFELELCQYSPAGEDFSVYIAGFSIRDVIEELVEYERDFDPDEHVRSVMDMRGAPGLRILVEDANAIADMISELADAMIDYEEDSDGNQQI